MELCDCTVKGSYCLLIASVHDWNSEDSECEQQGTLEMLIAIRAVPPVVKLIQTELIQFKRDGKSTNDD